MHINFMHMPTYVKYFAQTSASGSAPENGLGVLKHGCNDTEAALARQFGGVTETDAKGNCNQRQAFRNALDVAEKPPQKLF
ncbi:hypothetical protein M0D69_24910 [Caballeronia sp. SEWSISQ10-4 2]|uniref:hypothetical protein n=1 Tax=Caballeronia sp. SEWSISQ10-4 2 TaxID=2937438 RepID=UPI0026541A27|nr:hypothetical protein [Caballeronia sp. SEWSISQ10-4 2]MDN7181175.1 hypothetical protein [Caballeronia sp. SEWSISQ10-4 2]